jgi:tetratricopeptide (TPR) repeat protein
LFKPLLNKGPAFDTHAAMKRRRSPRSTHLKCLVMTALAVLCGTGCLKQIILDGQIASTRKASAALNTVGDFEVAQAAAQAGIATIEGLRYLAPENEDALFMLTRSWAGLSFGFAEDAMERAEDADGTGPDWDYHKRRAEAGYDRAIWYGMQLVEKKAPGFKDATKNVATMTEYWKQFEDKEDAELLFWLGNAWLGRAGVSKEKPELVSEVFIGVTMVERSVELDPDFMMGTGFVLLGAYHARTPMAELDEAKQLFEKAISKSDGKMLLPKVQLAIRYYCNKGDKENYEKLLNEVLAAGDGEPYQRLPNTIAKRKAFRWLGKERMRANCGF